MSPASPHRRPAWLDLVRDIGGIPAAVAVIVLVVRLDANVTQLRGEVADLRAIVQPLQQTATRNATRIDGIEQRLARLEVRADGSAVVRGGDVAITPAVLRR